MVASLFEATGICFNKSYVGHTLGQPEQLKQFTQCSIYIHRKSIHHFISKNPFNRLYWEPAKNYQENAGQPRDGQILLVLVAMALLNFLKAYNML